MEKTDSKTDAAKALSQNPDFLILKQCLLESLSEPSDVVDLGDVALARSYMHDMGIRNFFRWIDLASVSAGENQLAKTLKPFDHHGSTETPITE